MHERIDAPDTPGDPRLWLRRLTIGDSAALEEALRGADACAERCGLDALTVAFARIAALVGARAELPSLTVACNEALAQGATRDQVLGVLLAVTPAMGTAGVMAAAPRLGLALGIDVESDLEAPAGTW